VSSAVPTEDRPPKLRRGASGINGVVPLNKGLGMTSFQAVAAVRRIFGEKRVGHAGTLDPMASGMLPICIGQATRLVDYFHMQSKRYHCRVRLGETSNTLDTEGEVTSSGDASNLDEATVRAALPAFVGEISQVPPMYSAVRIDGKHLYELARQGQEIERAARTVTVTSVELLSFTPGAVAEVELDVICGKGAYMRVLAADLGETLGCGGLLAWLERTSYGTLTVENSVTVEQLAAMEDPKQALLPPSVAVDGLARIDLPNPLAAQVRRGQSVWVPKLPDPRPQGEVAVHAADGTLIAVGEMQGGLLRPVKVMAG
jgi:tRNA pseudouridine55 synthase